jgi:hypothetical protein
MCISAPPFMGGSCACTVDTRRTRSADHRAFNPNGLEVRAEVRDGGWPRATISQLMAFLKGSPHCPLDLALEVCKAHGLVEEQVTSLEPT